MLDLGVQRKNLSLYFEGRFRKLNRMLESERDLTTWKLDKLTVKLNKYKLQLPELRLRIS